VAIPNKKTVTIDVKHDNNFANPNQGQKANQFFHIPDSRFYTTFTVQTSVGTISTVNGAIAGNHQNGVASAQAGQGVLNNALALASGYGPIQVHGGDGNNGPIIGALAVNQIGQFELTTALPGGIVLGLTVIGGDGTIRVAMSGSAYSLGAPKGA